MIFIITYDDGEKREVEASTRSEAIINNDADRIVAIEPRHPEAPAA